MEKPTYLTSAKLAALGIRHGWFTRAHGVSQASFESLNVKKGFADSESNVDQNRRLAIRTLGLDPDNLIFIRHEHGSRILRADKSMLHEDQMTDGIISTNPDFVLGQGTADCGTIIIADKDKRGIGLIHASWRTLKSGIIAEAVKGLREAGAVDLVAGLGPAACGKCYEFGSEAKGIFDEKYLQPKGDKYLVDLKAMMYDQLKAAGVNEINDLGICTIEDGRFFSHRRDADDHGQTGRFFTVAALPD